jgi:DNA-binding PadR family transcriptional regulator
MQKDDLVMGILLILRRGSLHGYRISKEIENRTGKSQSWGSLYPTLKEMESKGLVTSKKVGRRKQYSITKKGNEKLRCGLGAAKNKRGLHVIPLMGALIEDLMKIKELWNEFTKLEILIWKISLSKDLKKVARTHKILKAARGKIKKST